MLKRLDILLKDKGYFESRAKAQSAILSGLVEINGQVIKDVAKKFDDSVALNIKISEQANKYVSRGAYKLESALNAFKINVAGKIAIDIGSSTGGFTDVLLQNGIKKVYAIDVGKNQLHNKIKNNPAVVSLENTDFREIEASQIADAEIVVTDVSFISIKPIAQKISEIFGTKNITIIALLKPQFECGKLIAKKYKGVINNAEVHKQVIMQVIDYWKQCGYYVNKILQSPIRGGDGNIEYLTLISKKQSSAISVDLIDKLVEGAFNNL